MTHPELITVVDTDTVEDLNARAETISAALASVRGRHSGYRFINPNEIRCNDWSCSRILTISPGVPGAADSAFAGHISHELDLLLAAADAER